MLRDDVYADPAPSWPIYMAVFRFYLPFGGRTPGAVKRQSAQFIGGKFVNQIATPMKMSLLALISKQLARHPARRPALPVATQRFRSIQSAKPQITWFGHSTFCCSLRAKLFYSTNFSRSPSPFQNWARSDLVRWLRLSRNCQISIWCSSRTIITTTLTTNQSGS